MKNFKIHIGGRRYRYFETLEAAKRAATEVFNQTGIVLSIEAVTA
jgi:hypothetical protein